MRTRCGKVDNTNQETKEKPCRNIKRSWGKHERPFKKEQYGNRYLDIETMENHRKTKRIQGKAERNQTKTYEAIRQLKKPMRKHRKNI